MLTLTQHQLARALRDIRPATLPGTRVIPDGRLRSAWYEVCSAVSRLQPMSDADARRFFDIAGVPD
jgi:hypothetical protein